MKTEDPPYSLIIQILSQVQVKKSTNLELDTKYHRLIGEFGISNRQFSLNY